MTESAKWLQDCSARFTRREMRAGLLLTIGLILFTLSSGLLFARLGFFRVLPVSVLIVWVVVLGAAGFGLRRAMLRTRALNRSYFANRLELEADLRRGFLLGASGVQYRSSSDSLIHLADTKATAWLRNYGNEHLRPLESGGRRTAHRSALLVAVSALVFLGAGPTNFTSASFWKPWAVFVGVASPIRLSTSHDEIRRGETVTVSIAAGARAAVTLWSRAPGESWRDERVQLDGSGRASIDVGPLTSDRFFTATAGRVSSDTLHVRVSLPIFVSELSLLARYPSYLEKTDKPLFPGTPVTLPRGTRVITQGRASVALESARWSSDDEARELAVSDNGFTGTLSIDRTAVWKLIVVPREGGALDEDPYSLTVIAVGDSSPQIAIPIPGVDTIPPLTLRQPLVIDTRDDNRVMRVEVSLRRVSRFGISSEPVVSVVPLPESGIESAVLVWTLDLESAGFLPGDTAFYLARAYDNAPAAQVTVTPEFVLRIPSGRELRQQLTNQSTAIQESVDSLTALQGRLQRRAEELVAEQGSEVNRTPSGGRRESGQLSFNAAERSRAISADQEALLQRAEELRDQLRRLVETAWEAGIIDPGWHQQMNQIRELLERAITSELREKLAELRDALERLDNRATSEALEDLIEAQRRMRDELERSRDLFERAALEGEMTSLAEEAEELAARQQDWTQSLTEGDSSLAAAERELAELVDSLASRLSQLSDAVRESTEGTRGLDSSVNRADEAAQQMRAAAQSAEQGEMEAAGQQGAAGGRNLTEIPQQLTQQRDELRAAWRREVLDMMDHALMETAGLATRQQDVERGFSMGDSDGDIRGEQAAIRDGVDRVIERIQAAAGKNALVSPSLAAALGFTKLKMTSALIQIQQATPNTREATAQAGEAVDGLNAVAHALLRSRSDVSGAASGSGVQEVLERLAELAEQQGSMNSRAGRLLPMMANGGDQLIQRLRDLAMQQRELAEGLESLDAQGDVSGADELSDAAEDIARDLEAGRLDRNTIERQERLFRRLLDAGRTLQSDDPDESLERRSETARDSERLRVNVRQAEIPSNEPLYDYPGWDTLVLFSPEERRLVLEYFRRINEGR